MYTIIPKDNLETKLQKSNVFGLCDEARVPGESPCIHMENIQTACRKTTDWDSGGLQGDCTTVDIRYKIHLLLFETFFFRTLFLHLWFILRLKLMSLWCWMPVLFYNYLWLLRTWAVLWNSNWFGLHVYPHMFLTFDLLSLHSLLDPSCFLHVFLRTPNTIESPPWGSEVPFPSFSAPKYRLRSHLQEWFCSFNIAISDFDRPRETSPPRLNDPLSIPYSHS